MCWTTRNGPKPGSFLISTVFNLPLFYYANNEIKIPLCRFWTVWGDLFQIMTQGEELRFLHIPVQEGDDLSTGARDLGS